MATFINNDSVQRLKIANRTFQRFLNLNSKVFIVIGHHWRITLGDLVFVSTDPIKDVDPMWDHYVSGSKGELFLAHPVTVKKVVQTSINGMNGYDLDDCGYKTIGEALNDLRVEKEDLTFEHPITMVYYA